MSNNNNIGRLAEDMKREIIDILGHMKDPRVQGFLTVMRVEVTADLDNARVFISVLGDEDAANQAIVALNHAAGHVRSEIAKRMHIRKSPAFRFVRDDGAAYAAHINKIIGELTEK
ncbi:MAG: 30S ribosome-binding factor RbfA [Pygmaiobacter sp.]